MPRKCFGRFASLQRPAFAIRRLDEPIGLGAVAGLQVFRIPLQLLAGPEGDRPQQVVLDQRTGVLEVAERRRARLAGMEPFLVMAKRWGNPELGRLKVARTQNRPPV